MRFDWTDEAADTAARMWLEKSSSSHIALAIGAPTRMCVIGKIHRMGLMGQGPTSNQFKPDADADAPPKRKHRKKVVIAPIAGETATINPGPPDGGERCVTAQLGRSTCEPSGADTGASVRARGAVIPTSPKTGQPTVGNGGRRMVNLDKKFAALPVKAPEPLAPGERPNILNVKPHHCRWPVWGDYERPTAERAYFCGEPKEVGAYCAEHADRSASHVVLRRLRAA